MGQSGISWVFMGVNGICRPILGKTAFSFDVAGRVESRPLASTVSVGGYCGEITRRMRQARVLVMFFFRLLPWICDRGDRRRGKDRTATRTRRQGGISFKYVPDGL